MAATGTHSTAGNADTPASRAERARRILWLEEAGAIEARVARQILAAAPVGAAPIDVARYLAGLKDQCWRGMRYNEQWPLELGPNPIIQAFFAVPRARGAVQRIVDDIVWSAACINWCLQRSGRQGSGSPDAHSFRPLIQEGHVAQYGDIAVFADVSAERELAPSGHVAFWTGGQGDNVQVLGAVHRFQGTPRIAESPMPRRRIDPLGRVDRILLGIVPIAAVRHIG